MRLKLDIEQLDDILLVRFHGELDHHASEDVKTRLEEALKNPDIKKLVFNFADLSFMDSSGLGVILGRYKTMAQKEGTLIVCAANPIVKKVLELSGIMKILPVLDKETDALSYLGVAQ